MKLRGQIILANSAISVLILLVVAVFLFQWLWNDRLESAKAETSSQLAEIDRTVTDFLSEVEADLQTIMGQDEVRSREDSGFTSFLTADPYTFQYSYGPAERKIVGLFNSYRVSHPYVSSVYMGRANGAFVRSHPRDRATAYDPRTRPWYLSAIAAGGLIAITDPYPSVTSSDVNIGVVQAMLDSGGKPYGVLGIDVTLARLTSLLSSLRLGHGASLLLADGAGTVLSAKDASLLFRPVSDVSEPLADVMKEGSPPPIPVMVGDRSCYVLLRRIALTGWTAVALVPASSLMAEVAKPLLIALGGVGAGLILLSLLATLALVRAALNPMRRFSAEASRIADTQDLDRLMDEERADEIGELARSWNSMIRSLRGARDELEAAQRELIGHKEHLEAEVAERTASLVVEKERAQAADRLKSAFLATMSHELRTPLNSIIGFTGIILKGMVGPLTEEQSRQLEMVMGSAKHLLALINDVLDISKIEAGQLSLADEPYDLAAVMDKASLAIAPLAEKKGLALLRDRTGELPPLRGDARRVEQILLNLLSNSVKFTESGSVTLSARSEGGMVVLEVSDTGIGIKEEDLPTLFQEFRQVDSGLSRKYEGTGLGLSISRQLVRMMGGDIWVHSKWGQGSVFGFSLPARKVE